MARIIATGPTPRRPNIFGTLGTAFGDSFSQEMARRAEAERAGSANLSLLEMQARAGGLDPSLPSVPAGGEAPLVLQPDVRERAQAQAGDPRLAILRQLKQDPSILADPTRFAAVTKLVNPPSPEPFTLSPGDVRFSGSGQEIARVDKPVEASSAIGKLYQDFQNGLVSREDFTQTRQNLLEAGRAGMEIRSAGRQIIGVDPRTGVTKLLYTAPSEAGDGRDRKRDAEIDDYLGFGLDRVEATALVDGRAELRRKPDGSFEAVFKSDGADGEGSVRAQKIQDYQDEFGVSRAQAVRLADKLARIETTQTGQTRYVDVTTGDVIELEVRPSEPVGPVAVAQDETLWAAAEGGTGLLSALEALGVRVGGQVGFNPDTEVLAKRRLLELATQDFIRAMSNNPRFPVGEQERIKREMAILPSVVDSTEALRAQMDTIDRYLSTLQEEARRGARDTLLPNSQRGEARLKEREVAAFRARLGVPRAPATEDGGADMPPELGSDGTVNLTPEQFKSRPPEERRRLIEAARKAQGG